MTLIEVQDQYQGHRYWSFQRECNGQHPQHIHLHLLERQLRHGELPPLFRVCVLT